MGIYARIGTGNELNLSKPDLSISVFQAYESVESKDPCPGGCSGWDSARVQIMPQGCQQLFTQGPRSVSMEH